MILFFFLWPTSSARIEGVVRSFDGRRPLANASVWLEHDEPATSGTVTGADGTFTLAIDDDELASGKRRRVLASHDDVVFSAERAPLVTPRVTLDADGVLVCGWLRRHADDDADADAMTVRITATAEAATAHVDVPPRQSRFCVPTRVLGDVTLTASSRSGGSGHYFAPAAQTVTVRDAGARVDGVEFARGRRGRVRAPLLLPAAAIRLSDGDGAAVRLELTAESAARAAEATAQLAVAAANDEPPPRAALDQPLDYEYTAAVGATLAIENLLVPDGEYSERRVEFEPRTVRVPRRATAPPPPPFKAYDTYYFLVRIQPPTVGVRIDVLDEDARDGVRVLARHVTDAATQSRVRLGPLARNRSTMAVRGAFDGHEVRVFDEEQGTTLHVVPRGALDALVLGLRAADAAVVRVACRGVVLRLSRNGVCRARALTDADTHVAHFDGLRQDEFRVTPSHADYEFAPAAVDVLVPIGTATRRADAAHAHFVARRVCRRVRGRVLRAVDGCRVVSDDGEAAPVARDTGAFELSRVPCNRSSTLRLVVAAGRRCRVAPSSGAVRIDADDEDVDDVVFELLACATTTQFLSPSIVIVTILVGFLILAVIF